jgi:hypothetical protein
MNVLSRGKQHDITIALMVEVQLFCVVVGSVSTVPKSFAVCQVVGYVYVKAKRIWPFTMCYSIC